MISHPLILGYVLIDSILLVFFAFHLKQILRTALARNPAAAAPGHQDPPPRHPAFTSVGLTALASTALATVLFVMAIAEALPAFVPGAMCGTGVLGATDGYGTRAIIFRVFALLTLAAWHNMDRLARSDTPGQYAPQAAKALLFALPFIALGAFESLRMTWHLDVDAPVSCCKSVAASASMGLSLGGIAQVIGDRWPWIYFTGTAFITWWAVHNIIKDGAPLPRQLFRVVGLVVIVWAVLSGAIVAHNPSSTFFEGQNHACFWCLFRPKNSYLGYPIFAALLIVVASVLGQSSTARMAPTGSKRHGTIALVTLGAFLLATLLPAIL